MFNAQLLVYPYPQAVFKEQNSLEESSLSDIVSPKFRHANKNPSTPFDFCHLQQMNSYQLAMWVWTFSYSRGWHEGELYALKVWAQDVTGMVLDMVNTKILECTLGIANKDHRDELLSEIHRLLPKKSVTQNTTIPYWNRDGTVEWVDYKTNYLSTPGIVCGQIGCESSTPGFHCAPCCSTMAKSFQTGITDETSVYNYSSRSSPCCSTMAKSFQKGTTDETSVYCNTSMSKETTDKEVDGSDKRAPSACYSPVTETRGLRNASKKGMKYRKLVLTLPDEDISQKGDVNRIRARFTEIDPDVFVKQMDEANKYTIAFNDPMRAKEALIKYRYQGYTIAFKFPRRPTPKAPIEYISLECLTIQTGKAFSGDIVGELSKGQRVTVNQVKGRRARLIKPDQEKWGWVSMYSSVDGRPMLRQVEDHLA